MREDLRHYLTSSAERFDLIISLPPPPENLMLNRFYTQGILGLCKKRLCRGRHLHNRAPRLQQLHVRRTWAITSPRSTGPLPRNFPVTWRHPAKPCTWSELRGTGSCPESGDALIRRYGEGLPLAGGPFERELTDNFSPDELRAYFEKCQLDYFEERWRPREKRRGKPGPQARGLLEEHRPGRLPGAVGPPPPDPRVPVFPRDHSPADRRGVSGTSGGRYGRTQCSPPVS